MNTKFIFVTGGVVSALGKGITAASLGNLLKARGKSVVLQKMDPYINLGPGHMSPLQHGEVFVTEDGAETDLDIGHYERYTNEALGRYSNCTAGRVYYTVIERERNGEYGGGTVQVIPHITDEIKRVILATTQNNPEIVITEIGGTVGDMESLPFIEAIRQLRGDLGEENCLFIHVTLVPYIQSAGELKTKPTQHSVKTLRSLGIQPDIIVCRAEMPLSDALKQKVALFCNVTPRSVVANIDCDCLYRVPLLLYEEGLDSLVSEKLSITTPPPDLTDWSRMVQAYEEPKATVTVGVVGAYTALRDAYFSAAEALIHGGIAHQAAVDLVFIDTKELLDFEKAKELLSPLGGIVLPAAYKEEITPGHINAAKIARELDISCLLTGVAMEALTRLDGRLSPMEQLAMVKGSAPLSIKPGTLLERIYQSTDASERHRLDLFLPTGRLESLPQGVIVSATTPDGDIVEALECPDNAFLLALNSHPEFKSRPNDAHPVFSHFIGAVLQRK
ncbi:CTP synthase [Eubacteriales bacterium OttesenSCG-928-M02]|nr:CTP synthase [Eubacteriales bacterium OttesenSCG-928-M02]